MCGVSSTAPKLVAPLANPALHRMAAPQRRLMTRQSATGRRVPLLACPAVLLGVPFRSELGLIVRAVLTECRSEASPLHVLPEPEWVLELSGLTPDSSVPVVANRTPLLDEPAVAPGAGLHW